MDKNYLSLPVKYQIEEFDDDRFLKVKIYVMHDKMNLNGSYFDMMAIESAKDTIKNVPILAFVRKNDGSSESDFLGHESEIVLKSDGDVDIKYLGRPIGVVPAENNGYSYEVFDDKTYVVVYGYIWKQYANEALGILQRDGEKSQSMEISIDDANWDDEYGWYNISKYKYTGLCVLGDDVRPAMVGAKVKVVEDYMKKFSADYEQKIAELYNALRTYESREEEVSVHGDLNVEQNEVKDEHTDNQDENLDKNSEMNTENTDNRKNEADDCLADDSEADIVDEGVASDCSDNPEHVDNSADKDTEIFNLNVELSKLTDRYKELEREVVALREFKNTIESEKSLKEKEKLFDTFSVGLTDDEIKPVRDKIEELTLKEIENELNSIFTKKNLEKMRQDVSFTVDLSTSSSLMIDVTRKNDSKSKYAV